MAKIILSFAIAVFALMTVFTSATEAGPKVRFGIGVGVGVPLFSAKPSKSYSKKRYKKKRVYRSTKKRRARPAKKRVVKRKARPTKKVVTAKTAPIKSETKDRNSSISTASVYDDEIIEDEVRPEIPSITAKTKPMNRNSSISAASVSKDETVAESAVAIDTSPMDGPAATTAGDTGCKQYFASVGMTLSVACE